MSKPKLSKFNVNIEETYVSSFEIEAETYKDAQNIIQAQYEANEILVDLDEPCTEPRYCVMDENFNILQEWE